MKQANSSLAQLPIILFGGSFDPIHRAHLYIAAQIQALLPHDRFYFVPCRQNNLKSDAPRASSQDRLAMLQAALKEHPEFAIYPNELTQTGPSYTITTLKQLRAKTKQPLILLMSTDVFSKFDQWHDWQGVLTLANLIVTPRPDTPHPLPPAVQTLLTSHHVQNVQALLQHTSGKILWQPIENQCKISATAIRSAIGMGQDPSDALPPPVARYIAEHRLYRQDQPHNLTRTL